MACKNFMQPIKEMGACPETKNPTGAPVGSNLQNSGS